MLFLATEELLVEAHETIDTPLLAAMFFVGSFTFTSWTQATDHLWARGTRR